MGWTGHSAYVSDSTHRKSPTAPQNSNVIILYLMGNIWFVRKCSPLYAYLERARERRARKVGRKKPCTTAMAKIYRSGF